MTLAQHIQSQLWVALRLCDRSPNPSQDARDLLQDVAVNIFKNVEYFAGRSADECGRLINKIIKNAEIDRWRRRRDEPKTFLYLDDMDDWWLEEEGIYNGGFVTNAFEVRNIREQVQGALIGMNQNWAQAIDLYTAGYSYEEIADIMATNTNTVGGYIRYARRELLKHLAA